MIANVSSIDSENKVGKAFDRYAMHFNDQKMMTSQCFIRNIGKIAVSKPELVGRIIDLLLKVDQICNYKPKQIELLKSDIINVFESIYEKCDHAEMCRIKDFVISQENSISPKTRKTVKLFLQTHK